MPSNDENADADPGAETAIGPPAADETELIPPDQAPTLAAWSLCPEVVEYPEPTRSWPQVFGIAAACVAAVALLVAAVGLTAWALRGTTVSSQTMTTLTEMVPPPPPPVTVTAAPPPSATVTVTPPTQTVEAAPSFSGRYTMTDTNPDTGQRIVRTWVVTSCGEGCARIVDQGDGSVDIAHLSGGFWSWDAGDITDVCQDGSEVHGAGSAHTDLSATTLRGIAHFTWRKVCAGSSTDPNINTIVLTRAGW